MLADREDSRKRQPALPSRDKHTSYTSWKTLMMRIIHADRDIPMATLKNWKYSDLERVHEECQLRSLEEAAKKKELFLIPTPDTDPEHLKALEIRQKQFTIISGGKDEIYKERLYVIEEDSRYGAIPKRRFAVSLWEVIKVGVLSTIRIKREDGSTQEFRDFDELICNVERNDLQEMYSIGAERFKGKAPDLLEELIIWSYIVTMFRPHDTAVNKIWEHVDTEVKSWRAYDICGVQRVVFRNGIKLYLLLDKEYPINYNTRAAIASTPLQVDYIGDFGIMLMKKHIKAMEFIYDHHIQI